MDIVRLPVEAEAVMQRWNPDGMNRLRPAREANPHTRAVAVLGADCVGKRSLVQELRHRIPDFESAASPAEAAVVLIVLDAGALIGRQALRIVEEAVTSGSRIMFALNKIDAHRDWRVVRERNLAVLAAHVPVLADVPIYPLSTRLACRARTRPYSAGVDLLWTSSGLVQLQASLVAELDRDPTRLRAQQLEWATRGIANETRRRILAKAESIRQGDEAAELRDERAQLVGRRDGGRAEAMAAVRSRIQLAKVDLLHDVGNRIRIANVAARNEIDRSSRTQLPEFPARLQEMAAEVTATVDDRTHDRLGELRELLAPATGRSAEQQIGKPVPLPAVSDGPEPRHRGIEDRITIALGASAGVGLGRLAVSPLSLVPAMQIATIPVMLILGGLAAWWLTRSRAQIAERAHMRQWAAEALVSLKSQLEQRLHGAIVETEGFLAEHVVRASTARMVEVDRQIARADAELRQLMARRSGQLASCERDLDVIDRGIGELDRARA